MKFEKFGWAFIFFRICRNSYFHVAFSLIYFQSLGFTLSQSLMLESFYYISKAIFEVPGGILADQFGRKNALVASAVISAVSYLGIGLSSSYLVLALCEIGIGISMSFSSGTDSALIFDEYKAQDKVEEYQRVESIGWGMRNISRGVASAFGSIFAAWYSMAGTFILSSVVIIFSAPIAVIYLKEINRQRSSISQIFYSIIYLIKNNQTYRHFIIQFSLITMGVKVGFWAFQPFAMEHGIPLSWVGGCFTLILLVSLIASFFTEKITNIAGYINTQVALGVSCFFFMGISFYFSGVAGILIMAIGFLLHAILQGISDPIMRIKVNKCADSRSRATAMSVTSMFGDISFAIFAPIFGYLVENYGGDIASYIVSLIVMLSLLPYLFLQNVDVASTD